MRVINYGETRTQQSPLGPGFPGPARRRRGLGVPSPWAGLNAFWAGPNSAFWDLSPRARLRRLALRGVPDPRAGGFPLGFLAPRQTGGALSGGQWGIRRQGGPAEGWGGAQARHRSRGAPGLGSGVGLVPRWPPSLRGINPPPEAGGPPGPRGAPGGPPGGGGRGGALKARTHTQHSAHNSTLTVVSRGRAPRPGGARDPPQSALGALRGGPSRPAPLKYRSVTLSLSDGVKLLSSYS